MHLPSNPPRCLHRMDPTRPPTRPAKPPKKPHPRRSDSREPSSSGRQLQARCERLQRQSARLDSEIAELEKRGVSTDLAPQMLALHEYNEMKDLAQMVLGRLADVEQVSVTELHRRFGLPME